MLRIHFDADDFAHVSFAPYPAPLVELKLSLMMVRRTDSELGFGRWRRGVRQRLPATTRPLWDLLQPFRGPAFLDPVSESLDAGLELVRSMPHSVVRSDIARLERAPTQWVNALIDDDPAAWDVLARALQDAYEAVLGPSWTQVREQHAAEFTRYAFQAAAHGVARTLTGLCPGSRIHDGVWEIDGGFPRDVKLRGRGLMLLPTFHWTHTPLFGVNGDHQVLLVYPAGPGVPIMQSQPDGDALADVLGTSRARALRLLADPHNTTDLAAGLGVSLSNASSHAAALRRAGLVATARDGRGVRHERTALGRMLAEASPVDRDPPP